MHCRPLELGLLQLGTLGFLDYSEIEGSTLESNDGEFLGCLSPPALLARVR